MSKPGFRVRRQIGRVGGAADPNNLARRPRRFHTAEESAHFPSNRAWAPPVYYRFVTHAEPPLSQGRVGLLQETGVGAMTPHQQPEIR